MSHMVPDNGHFAQYQQQLLQQQHANMMMMMNQVSGRNQGQKPGGGGNGKTPNRRGATSNTTTRRKKIKLPRTCFVIFRSEQNADIKKKHPNLDFGDISKEIARRWKSLSPEDKLIWINKAKTEKEAWEAQHGSVQEYKQQQQAASNTPLAQERRVQELQARYSAFAFFKRVFNKKVT